MIFESHWFLFDCDQKEIRLDWEHEEFAWADPSRLEAYKLGPLVRGFARSVNGRRLTEGHYSSDPA